MPDTSFTKKLRITSGKSACILNAPPGYGDKLGIPHDRTLGGGGKKFDVVQLFARTKEVLEAVLPETMKSLSPDGLLWIAFPKKTSGIQSDLTRDGGWEIVRSLRLRQISLVSIDDEWSAFSFKQSEKEKHANQQRPASGIPELKKCIDTGRRKVRLPADVKARLAGNDSALRFFNELAFTHKKEYIVWIVSAKKEETRQRRVEQMTAMLQKRLKHPSDKKTS